MKKRKPIRRASTHYGPWHVMLASPEKPMQPSRYRHQLTRMHLAMASITSGESPTDEDWRLIADAINLVETLVLQGVAQDESGLLHDAITAMAEAFYRADQDSARMRLTGPGLSSIRAVLADWGTCLEQLPERTVIEAHIATDRRIAEKLRRYRLGNRAKVVTRFEVQA